MAARKKITLFETPGVVLRRRGDGIFLGEVLTDYPKHPQLMVAGSLSDVDAEVQLIDMKSLAPNRLEEHGEIPYGSMTLEKLMTGTSFESVNLTSPHNS